MAGQSRGREPLVHPEGIPLVATLGRAADLLGIDPARLGSTVAAAGLQPRARHANGEPCWAWPELLAVARSLGVDPPAVLDAEQQRDRSPLAVRQNRGRAAQRRKAERPGRQA
jgi:hypothetical protein